MVSDCGWKQTRFEFGRVSPISKRLTAFSNVVDKEVKVVDYSPNSLESQQIQAGNSVEVRGTVLPLDDKALPLKLKYTDLNKFEGDFDHGTYEQMLNYYHDMCKHLCVAD